MAHPVRTGQLAAKATTGADLVANGGFERGDLAGLPPGWTCRLPTAEALAEPVTDTVHSGRRGLRLHAVSSPAFEGKPPWERQLILESARIKTLVPGCAYRLAAWLKAGTERTSARLEALIARRWHSRLGDTRSVSRPRQVPLPSRPVPRHSHGTTSRGS